MLTKAGEVKIYFNNSRHVAFVKLPHRYQETADTASTSEILGIQPHLQEDEEFAKLPDFFPSISVIEGMAFPLIDLSDHVDVLTSLGTPPCRRRTETKWSTAIFYALLASGVKDGLHYHQLRIRGFESDGKEETASAVGACTVAAHLALRFGGPTTHHVFAVEQAVEINRNSQMCVEVELTPDAKKVKLITLSGRVSFIFQGEYLGVF